MRPIDRRLILGVVAGLPLASCNAPTQLKESEATNKSASEEKDHGQPGDLIELTAMDPTIQLDMRYATTNNFTGRALYKMPRAFLVRVAAEAVINAHHAAVKDGFGLTIFDAYRPWSVTKALWDATPPGPQRNYVANPKRGSRHNRGCAVDLTLHSLADGQPVEMPSAFDDFSPRAHRRYDDDTAEARSHAEHLESYMQSVGFAGMSNEWWHFDYRDWADYPIRDEPFGRL